ncbi:MAG: SPFH domain-containing protein [Planctomycetes bacterium]|nr:SPFH domain-containing protein [Planctomycetota bacterium]
MKDAYVDTVTTENLNRRNIPGFLRKRFGLLGSIILILFFTWAVWSWGFCRFYVGPGQMAIVTAKSGMPLPPGQILAKEGQKGVLEAVLGEGRHIWNPIFYDWEIVPAQFIPPGKIGVVTSLVGDTLPPGEFLAEPGQKGVWRRVLGPGRYRLNPIGYTIDIIDAISIPVGFAGVVTNLSGTPAEEGAFARPDEKGVRADVLQPGIYYINPREYGVSVVEVGVNQVSLVGQAGGMILTRNVVMDDNNLMLQRLHQNVLDEQKRRREEYQQMTQHSVAEPVYTTAARAQSAEAARPQAPRQASERNLVGEIMDDPGAAARRMITRTLPVEQASGAMPGRLPIMEMDVPPAFILNQFVSFPSRDGFDISLDMTVEFELRPERLAAIYRDYGDLPAVVDKILMPQILSVSRLKGSAYRAVDFIAGEGREKFQNELTEALQVALSDKNLLIHSALISNVNVPSQILEPLRATSLSKETDLTNREKQNTAKKQADLNREMSLIEQSGAQVIQETDKLKALIDAEMRKTVAMIQADTVRQMAAIEKETASVRAYKSIVLGQAEATSVRMVGEEQAKGFGMKVRAFGRDGGEYALYEFAMRLSPDLRINLIHAGEGTLWTDLKNASLAEIGGAAAVKGK